MVTCVEKLVYLRNPDNLKQWLDLGQSTQTVEKQGRFLNRFRMNFEVCLNFAQVIHFEIIPHG